MQLGDIVPVQLMHKDKAGSFEEVSARRVRLPPLTVVVVECAVSKELSDFILEPVDNSPQGVLPSRSFNKSGKSGLINMTPLDGSWRLLPSRLR